MIFGRSIKGLLIFSQRLKPRFSFSINNINKPSHPSQRNKDILSNIEQKISQKNKPDQKLITNMLRMMVTKFNQVYQQEQLFIQKHIKQLTIQHLLLLLAYLSQKYGRMVPEKIFITTTKRLREIKDLSPKEFRRLVGAMMRLKWEQDVILRLYIMFEARLKEFQTQDLCFLVLYSQYVKKINLGTIQKYIRQLLQRNDHTRKSNFLLYQALHSQQAKNNFAQLLLYKQSLRNFENTLKNSQYLQIHRKWEFLDALSKSDQTKQKLEDQLAKYPALTLKENHKLVANVEEVFQKYFLELAPAYLSQLLSIVPKKQYLSRYIQKHHQQLSDLQKLQILQKVAITEIPKQILKPVFLKLFGQKHQIQKDYFERVQKLGESVGVQNIRKHQQHKQP